MIGKPYFLELFVKLDRKTIPNFNLIIFQKQKLQKLLNFVKENTVLAADIFFLSFLIKFH